MLQGRAFKTQPLFPFARICVGENIKELHKTQEKKFKRNRKRDAN